MADRPNVILIIADQMRGDCLDAGPYRSGARPAGAGGHPTVRTPNLDYLASLGVRFCHAYTAVPSCIPARASLMTGMNAWHAGILGMGRGQGPMPNDFPHTLAGELTRAGYRTHLVGKGHFHPQRASMGFESRELDESGRVQSAGYKSDYRIWFDLVKQKEITPDDHGIDWNSWLARPWHTEEYLHPTAWTVRRAIHFLEHREPDRPFFLNVSFARPHSPYVPPAPYFDMYYRGETPPPSVGDWAGMHDRPEDAVDPNAWHGRMSPQDIHRARSGYCGEVSFIDAQIGRLMYWLRQKQRETYLNTLFIFTSDHGDMQGDHNLWRKTYAYEGSARIPFVVVPPLSGPRPGRKVADEPVELQDVMPTILDAAGVEIPPTVDGRSVLPLGSGPAEDWRAYIHGEHCTCYSPVQEMQYVTDGRRKFIWLPRAGIQQFFDLETDPGECRNLTEDPRYREEIELWRGYLARELEARDCCWAKDGHLVDPPPPEPLVSPYKNVRYEG